jgi:hypothetical protein
VLATLYTLAATHACLTGLPNAVAGLPPARPPAPPALFVDALAHDDSSTGKGEAPRPRAHKQLAVWTGYDAYQGLILSFFKSDRDAKASFKTLAWLYGGRRVGNVVVTWAQKPAPRPIVRATALGCLRSGAAGPPAAPTRPANLATFAGRWRGHGRGLSITSSGRGSEFASDGCCMPIYRLSFQIDSVTTGACGL